MRVALPILVALTFCGSACEESHYNPESTGEGLLLVLAPAPASPAPAQPTCDVGPAATADAPPEEEPDCELTRLERMLQDHCGMCHSEVHFAVATDFRSCPMVPVTFAELLEIGKVTPGDAQGSRLLIRLRDNSMPPPSSMLEPLSEQQIEQLAAFVDSLEPRTPPTCEPVTGPASE